MPQKRRFRSIPYEPAELVARLVNQRIFLHRHDICAHLVKSRPRILELEPKDILIREHDRRDKDVYCILSGKVGIKIGNTVIAWDRGMNQHVGEMSVISKEPRSATVFAVSRTQVLRVPESVFRDLLDRFPAVWQPIAETLCERLSERRRLVRLPNPKPKVFIGSSGKRAQCANQLKTQLMAEVPCDVEVWNEPAIFRPSAVTIGILVEKSREADFGIFLFGADDRLTSNRAGFVAPRDNVVFESGLFTGSCGLERTFILCENRRQLKIPTDLAGVSVLQFDLNRNVADFSEAVAEIAGSIRRAGVI